MTDDTGNDKEPTEVFGSDGDDDGSDAAEYEAKYGEVGSDTASEVGEDVDSEDDIATQEVDAKANPMSWIRNLIFDERV